jgi:Protein of unknown function (DUF2971)
VIESPSLNASADPYSASVRRFKRWRNALEKKVRKGLRKPGKTAPPIPKSNTTIWRYMSRRAFLQLVTNRRLMFHRFKELQTIDAREGMVVPGFWRSVLEYMQAIRPYPVDLGNSRRINEAILDRLRCLTYASCWNMAKHENNLMWKAYAPKGVAIRTTIEKFRNAPQQNQNEPLTIELQKIVYADNWRQLDQRGYRHSEKAQNMLFLHTKRRAFSSEREIRFRITPFGPDRGEIGWGPDHITVTFSYPLPACPEWFPVVFENLDWIEEVVAESSISSRAASTIRREVKQHNLKFRVSDL